MSTEHQSPLSSWGLKFRIWSRRWEVGHRCSGAFHSFVVNVHFPTKVATSVLSILRKHWSLLDFRPKNTKTGEQVHEAAHFFKKRKKVWTQNKYLSLPGLSLVTWWKQNRLLSDNTWRQWEHSISVVWIKSSLLWTPDSSLCFSLDKNLCYEPRSFPRPRCGARCLAVTQTLTAGRCRLSSLLLKALWKQREEHKVNFRMWQKYNE